MKKIFLIISLLLTTTSNFATKVIGCYFISVEDKWKSCRSYSIVFYENNNYEIGIERCPMDGEPIDDIKKTKRILSHGTFVRKGEDGVVLTEAVSGNKIQLRYIFVEYKPKTQDTIIKLPRWLKVEEGAKELNDKTFSCLYDLYFDPPKR